MAPSDEAGRELFEEMRTVAEHIRWVGAGFGRTHTRADLEEGVPAGGHLSTPLWERDGAPMQ